MIEPLRLPADREARQLVAVWICKGLEELRAIWSTAACLTDEERGETLAASDGKASELKQHAEGGGGDVVRMKVFKLECL